MQDDAPKTQATREASGRRTAAAGVAEAEAQRRADPSHPSEGGEAAESRTAEDDDGPHRRRAEASRPSEGGSPESVRSAGEGRIAREGETPAALADADGVPSARPSAAP